MVHQPEKRSDSESRAVRRHEEKSSSGARSVALGVLTILAALSIFLLWTTRNTMTHLPFLNPTTITKGSRNAPPLVDQTPWLTAQALAPLAVTAEEGRYARTAERLADHSVDLAFSFALRKADMDQRQLSGPSLALAQKVQQIQQMVAQDQAHVDALSHPGTVQAGHTAEKLPGNLDIWKAQLSLDTDILHDTETALAHVSGDPRAEIERQLKAREASLADYDKQAQKPFDPAMISVQRHHTLASRVDAWLAQSSRRKAIRQARIRATQDAAALTAQQQQLQTLLQQAGAAQAGAAQSGAAQAGGQDALSSLQKQAAYRELLAIVNDRIQTENRLAQTYRQWGNQVELQHGILLHLIAQSALWLSLILISMLIADTLVRQWTSRSSMDQRRLHTLRAIADVTIQLVGVVLILLVVFGVPDHLTTIIGLATAGITVAFQDFLLAFVGWFVLIGKGGIRIGDLVQINGALGEVIEIRLFRTTLLEMGDSPDNAHPTGRRVTMLNSFPITGQYYCFSTEEQWMWDDLTINLPRSESTLATAERIQQVVREATEADARLAEKEWHKTLGPLAQEHASADTELNLRPTDGGSVSVHIRFVTRAVSRLETRNRLFQKILEAMGAGSGQGA